MPYYTSADKVSAEKARRRSIYRQEMAVKDAEEGKTLEPSSSRADEARAFAASDPSMQPIQRLYNADDLINEYQKTQAPTSPMLQGGSQDDLSGDPQADRLAEAEAEAAGFMPRGGPQQGYVNPQGGVQGQADPEGYVRPTKINRDGIAPTRAIYPGPSRPAEPQQAPAEPDLEGMRGQAMMGAGFTPEAPSEAEKPAMEQAFTETPKDAPKDDKTSGSGFGDFIRGNDIGGLISQIGIGILTNPGNPMVGLGKGVSAYQQNMYRKRQDQQVQENEDRTFKAAETDKAERRAQAKAEFAYGEKRDAVADQRYDQKWEDAEEDEAYDRGRDAVGDDRWQQSFDADRSDASYARRSAEARASLQDQLTRSQIARNERPETPDGGEYTFTERELPDGSLVEARRNKLTGAVEYDTGSGWTDKRPEGAIRPQDGYTGDRNSLGEKSYAKTIEEGDIARRALHTTRRSLDLLTKADADGTYFGPGGGAVQGLRQLAGGLGLSDEALSSANTVEQLVALNGEAMLKSMSQLGGNDSNEELRTILKLGFNPSDTLAGNIAKMRQVEAAQSYLDEKGKFFMRHKGNSRQAEADWIDHWGDKRIYEGLPNDGAASGGGPKTKDGRSVDDLLQQYGG